MINEKILELEQLLQSLSDEMLQLKSVSKHYDETKEHLQNMCESIDQISVTYQKLTTNMTQLLAEMEKMNVDGEKTRKYIQSINDEAKDVIKVETHRHELAVASLLSKNHSELTDEFRKQTDKILQQNLNQSKDVRLIKSLTLVGILIEVVLVIRMFF